MSRDNQLWIEDQYSPKHNAKRVWEDLLSSPEVVDVINTASKLLEDWVESESTYDSKKTRKDALRASYEDLGDVVRKVITTVVMEGETTLTNVVMRMSRLTELDGRQGILLAAEVLAVICESDAYDIYKQGTVLMIRANLAVEDELQDHLNQTCYLPPLIAHPKKIRGNWDTPYYSYEGESLILGSKENHHEGDICLDVINKQNATPLALSMDFIATYEEQEPDFCKDTEGLSKAEKNRRIASAKKSWMKYQKQTSYFTHLLNGLGNKIWLGNRVDKRGRMYASGYHISPQGSSYRKAAVELYETHLIEVPEQYRT
jgi:hypothetical protein